MLDYKVVVGNPPDAPMPVPGIVCIEARFGRAPEAVAAIAAMARPLGAGPPLEAKAPRECRWGNRLLIGISDSDRLILVTSGDGSAVDAQTVAVWCI